MNIERMIGGRKPYLSLPETSLTKEECWGDLHLLFSMTPCFGMRPEMYYSPSLDSYFLQDREKRMFSSPLTKKEALMIYRRHKLYVSLYEDEAKILGFTPINSWIRVILYSGTLLFLSAAISFAFGMVPALVVNTLTLVQGIHFLTVRSLIKN